LGSGTSSVFDSIAESVLKLLGGADRRPRQNQQPSAKQTIFLLHAFSQAECAHEGLFAGLVPLLRSALSSELQGATKRQGPSRSDWVVAYGAFAGTGLHMLSEETVALCRDIVRHCCEGLGSEGEDTGSGLSAMDVSHLLRALAKGSVGWSGPAVGLLLSRVLSRPAEFSQTELLVALHAAVQIRDDRVDEVQVHLYNGLLSLLSEELVSGSLRSLKAPDLITASALLAKTGHLDTSAWSSLSRQLAGLLDARLTPSTSGGSEVCIAGGQPESRDDIGSGDEQQSLQRQHRQLAECLIVVLNCFSRIGVQDAPMLRAAYHFLADGSPGVSSGIAVAAFAKLGAASCAEAKGLALPVRDVASAWWNLLHAASSNNSAAPSAVATSLSDLSLRLVGLAHALAGSQPAPWRLRRVLRLEALSLVGIAPEMLQEPSDSARLEEEAESFVEPAAGRHSLVASCSQVLTGLQCLFLLRPSAADNCDSLPALRACIAALDAVQGPLEARGRHRPHSEPALAATVLDVLEQLCSRAAVEPATSFSMGALPQLPVLRPEHAVAQYFIDAALLPAS